MAAAEEVAPKRRATTKKPPEATTEGETEDAKKTEAEAPMTVEATNKKVGQPKAKAAAPKGKAAKVKAKAKAAAAKKKAKAKPKASVKRPAAHVQAAQSSEGKQKKASLHEKLKEWKGLSLEEDAPEEGEESQEEGDSGEESALAEGKAQLRDFAKARKYKRLQDKGAIPSHILDMIENVSKTKEKPREFKSALINNLFEGDGKGGYKLCANKPMFESHKEAYHRQYGKDQTKGLPRDVFLFQSFHGNEQALDAAIGRGSVQQWVEDGIEYCGYRSTLAGTEKSNLDLMKLREGEKKVSQDQYSALAKSFKSLAWSFGDVEEGAQSSSSGAKPAKPKQKALEAAGLTKQMKELVTEAKSAHERLLGAAMKMIGKCSSLEDKKEFKTTVMDLKQWVTWNDHVLTWEVQHLVSMCIVMFSNCVCD